VVACWLLECTISQFNLLTPATYLLSPRKVHRKATFYLRDFLRCKFVVKIAGFSVVRVTRSSVFYVHILFYRSLFVLCYSFMPLYCLSFDLRIMITPLVSSNTYLSFCPFSFCHCFVGPSSIYEIWLYQWYLQILLCPFPLCHCIVCLSISGFWIFLWYLQIRLYPYVIFR
jgi:hypothetical protein